MMNNSYSKSEEDYNMFDWWKKAIIENYANFKGRARRKEYWYTTLVNFIVGIILYIPLVMSFVEMESTGEPTMLYFISMGLFLVYVLALFIPNLALIVRRLHDVGKSGWFYFISLIPLVGAIILLVQYVTDSQSGENKWGPNPKGIGNKNNLNEIGVKED